MTGKQLMISVVVGITLGLFLAWFEAKTKVQACIDYSAMTGREIQMIHGECYVRTGDHFVPRSEYGRQP